MFDDFFTRALIAGIGIAIIAGPFGCMIIWRRMAYFGDTLAHAALLGVAFAFLFHIHITLMVFVLSAFLSLSFIVFQKKTNITSDALLGIMAHASLALGLVVISLMPTMRIDLTGFLFGDILAISKSDIAFIYGGGFVILGGMALIWQRLFVATISEDIAHAETKHSDLIYGIFMLLLALLIAIAMKMIGVLLMTALLIIPAATARSYAKNPEIMAVMASLIGCLSVIIGLQGSLHFDTPSGPSIIVIAFALFLLSLISSAVVKALSKKRSAKRF
jgi:zinc transport system permease protein